MKNATGEQPAAAAAARTAAGRSAITVRGGAYHNYRTQSFYDVPSSSVRPTTTQHNIHNNVNNIILLYLL